MKPVEQGDEVSENPRKEKPTENNGEKFQTEKDITVPSPDEADLSGNDLPKSKSEGNCRRRNRKRTKNIKMKKWRVP